MDKLTQYERLLQRLRRARYVSGSELAVALSVSRTVVNRRLHELAELGLRIHAVTGKGYHLDTQISLLDEQSVARSSVFECRRHLVTRSTNEDVLALARLSPQPVLVVTEFQTAGRGRRGKQWQSDFGQDLAFSIGFPLRGVDSLKPYSLCVGLLLAETLSHHYDLPVRVKWPNDLLIGGCKLAGILTEIHTLGETPYVIVGMGLNVNRVDLHTLGQPAISLREATGELIDRNALLARLSVALGKAVKEDFTRDWYAQWRDYDGLVDKPVAVHLGDRTVEGLAAGVAADGSFLVQLPDGEIQRFSGGEISVRPT